MKDFTVPMALADFIPVALFLVAAIMIQRDLYGKMSKGAFALFAAGTIDIFCAGFLKALYKLLYAAGVCDFEALNNIFFPMQAIGFLLAGLGVAALLCHRQNERAAVLAAPGAFSGTGVFVGLMVAGVLAMNGGLSLISFRMKKPLAGVLFIVSFVCSLAMGYLASRDFSSAAMNWAAEGVNIAGQGALLAAAALLHKAGLREFKLDRRNAK